MTGSEPLILRRRCLEDREAYLDRKRAELVAAGKDTSLFDLVAQVAADGPALAGEVLLGVPDGLVAIHTAVADRACPDCEDGRVGPGPRLSV